MMRLEKKNIVFIVNPISGVGRQQGIENLILQNLDTEQFDYSVRYTQGPGDATALTSDALAQGAEVVVVVGGDGSVNEVAKAMVGSGKLMAIVPAGSGNGLAHHLGIPIRSSQALQLLNRHTIQTIDTATCNGEFFVSIAGVGFDALVADKFSNNKYRGFIAYLSIILTEFRRYRPEKYQLILDGTMVSFRAFLVSFANSGQFGYNTTIAPNALVDDGLIDVCVVGKPRMIALPGIVRSLFKKKIDKTGLVAFYKAKEIKVIREKEGFVNLDGEAIQMGKEILISVNPLSLQVAVPELDHHEG